MRMTTIAHIAFSNNENGDAVNIYDSDNYDDNDYEDHDNGNDDTDDDN